jgi:hypothetical protein
MPRHTRHEVPSSVAVNNSLMVANCRARSAGVVFMLLKFDPRDVRPYLLWRKHKPHLRYESRLAREFRMLALPPTSKPVMPSIPRCSKSLRQPRIVS